MHRGRRQFSRVNCSGRKRLMSLVHEPGTLELMQINADIGAGAIVMLTARMAQEIVMMTEGTAGQTRNRLTT